MALDLLTGRGCVVRVKGQSGGAAYKIEGWPSGQMGNGLITIDDITPTKVDLASPIVAVDNYRSLHRFGKNFGQIQVHGTLYLGPVRDDESGVLSKVSSAFDKLRLSSKKTPVNVSITSGYKCKAYFTSMAFGQADPQFNKVSYTLSGLISPNS